MENVVLKLARGHLAFEFNVFHFEEPTVCEITPIVSMSQEEWLEFWAKKENCDWFFPEIGSRAFITFLKSPDKDWRDWREVQEGRYYYRVEQSIRGDEVQFIIGEYLACQVMWE